MVRRAWRTILALVLISFTWTLRSDQSAIAFGRARRRRKLPLETTREKLLKVKEHLEFLHLEVALPEPLEEEVQELRDWLESMPRP